MDEGNIFEALLEGWKQGLRNTLVDHRLQPPEPRCGDPRGALSPASRRCSAPSAGMSWCSSTARCMRGGLRASPAASGCGTGSTPARTSSTPPSPSRAAPPGASGSSTISATRARSRRLIERRSDEELARLMTNLGGHDLPSLLEAFESDRPRPADGVHRLHDQGLRPAARRPQGQPCRAPDADARWRVTAPPRASARATNGTGSRASTAAAGGARALPRRAVPFDAKGTAPLRARRRSRCRPTLPTPKQAAMSTQQGFGLILNELARSERAARRAHRHDLAGRDGLDQSRRPGSTGAASSPARR